MATVGIDVGGTKCLGVALSGGTVAAEARHATPDDKDALMETLAELVSLLGKEVGEAVEAVGLGVPGLVDREGVLFFAPNLRGATGLAARAGLEDRVGVPVVVDNDATCAAWGEYRAGAGQGLADMLLVTLGTGIGGGIVTGGRIERGFHGFAGEMGHMVVDPSGPACPCGRRGCWERFASGSGLARLAQDAAAAGRAGRVLELAGGEVGGVRGEHVTQALGEGDADAAAIVGRMAWWLALGLANLVNILDPAGVVVGGGLVDVGPALLDPAREELARQLAGQGSRPSVPVLPATLGPRAGAIGAAFLAADER